MHARRFPWLLLILLSATPVARGEAPPPDASSDQSKKGGGVKPERVSTQMELKIDSVVPRGRYTGTALATATDPRFVLVGQVVWVQRPDVIALHSKQAFAIHSPTGLGLNGWQRGATICLLLTRIQIEGRTQWELSAMVPDAGEGVEQGLASEGEAAGAGGRQPAG